MIFIHVKYHVTSTKMKVGNSYFYRLLLPIFEFHVKETVHFLFFQSNYFQYHVCKIHPHR